MNVRTIMIVGALVATHVSSGPAAEETGEGEEAIRPGLSEKVTVTASRLAEGEVPPESVPAFVTVITRDQITRSGARTLQDLLSLEAGVIVHDQTGNGVEKTFDMRGFSDGSGTAFFLDGARLNDPRNNTVALEMVSLEAIERIEIIRGPSAALAGGGSEAGVIHLVTRRGGATSGSISAGGGTFGSSRAAGSLSARAGRFDLFLSAGRDETDGFRENADGDLRRFSATAGVDLGEDRRLALSLASTDARFGNPGALTESELRDDREEVPFNALDGSDTEAKLASLNYRGSLPAGLSIAANLFHRENDSEILSTGRAASLFGGFLLGSDTRVTGSTLQISHLISSGPRTNTLTFGAEWLDGRTDALGYSTPADDPGNANTSSPDSSNQADRRVFAFFVQDTWNPSPSWSLTAGARFDRDRIGYDETVPDPALEDSRSFSEVSLRAGVSWNPMERFGTYVSYGEAFLPPTVEQLFAFPLFGSNPDLDPQDSRSFEAGVRTRWTGPAAGSLQLSLFQIDTTDEIIFDPDSSLGPFGANINAGETRRRGIEAAVRTRGGRTVDAFANLSLTDAEFRKGDNRGRTVPLVPRERAAAGVNLALPAGLASRVEAVYVGDQVLDNDAANEQDRLGSYVTVNLRATWTRAFTHRPPSGAAHTGGEGRRLTLFAEARNLFDRAYSTRGIYAFNFDPSSFENEVFLTPAPGRGYLAGAEWSF
jgi:iron complex outermembrane receptor protein